MKEPVDVRGKTFAVGQSVARARALNAGGSAGVEVCKVTRIENGKVFLADSKIAMKFPNRLAILED